MRVSPNAINNEVKNCSFLDNICNRRGERGSFVISDN